MLERIATVAEALVLTLWVGAMAGFAFVFAPTAFHIVTDLNQFADVTAHVLTSLGKIGVVCGTIAIVCAGARMRSSELPLLGLIRIVLVIVMLGFSAYETAVIIPAMNARLVALGAPLSSLAKDDPRRVAYDAEHRFSSTIYGVVLLCGIAVVGIAALDREDALARVRR
jgi:hypothetical protein